MPLPFRKLKPKSNFKILEYKVRNERKFKRVMSVNTLRSESNKKKKRDIIFTFRKGTFPNRASFEPIPRPIYDRHKIITERDLGRVISVYNGIIFFNYKIPVEALGYKFGEVSPTKQWKPNATHFKYKKSKKKSEKSSKKLPKVATTKKK